MQDIDPTAPNYTPKLSPDAIMAFQFKQALAERKAQKVKS